MPRSRQRFAVRRRTSSFTVFTIRDMSISYFRRSTRAAIFAVGSFTRIRNMSAPMTKGL